MNKGEEIGSENRALIIWMQNNILDRLSETAMCVRWWCARIEHKLTQNVQNAYQLKQNEEISKSKLHLDTDPNPST